MISLTLFTHKLCRKTSSACGVLRAHSSTKCSKPLLKIKCCGYNISSILNTKSAIVLAVRCSLYESDADTVCLLQANSHRGKFSFLGQSTNQFNFYKDPGLFPPMNSSENAGSAHTIDLSAKHIKVLSASASIDIP
jgi:hypothetical protein